MRGADFGGTHLYGFNVAGKFAALDPVVETEGMDEVQKNAGHEIGGDVLGGKAEGDAQDADAGEQGSHRQGENRKS